MRFELVRLIWMASLSAVLLGGCASTRSATEGTAGDVAKTPVVTNVSFQDTGSKTVVTIAAEMISSYATYRLDNPSRLVVDLQGVTPGAYDKPIVVNQGVVTSITPSMPQQNRARFEIGLAQQVEFNAVKRNNDLILEVDKPILKAESVNLQETAVAKKDKDQVKDIIAQAEKTGAAPQGGTKNMAPATALTDVKVETGVAGSRVVIKGNGLISAEALLLENEQLVVDVQEVKNAVFPNSFAVDDPLIKRVRIGQFTDPAKKTRVALELRTNVGYSFKKDGDQVVLALVKESASGEAPAAKAGEKNAEKAAEKAAEKNEAAPGGYTGKRISLDFQEADLKSVLRLIAEVSGLNLVLAPDVKGTVSVKMLNVPWDQALDLILKINGLAQVREGNIMRVMSVGALAKEEQDAQTRKEAQKKVEDTVSKIIPINYAKAKELSDPLKKSLSARGEITVEERTNTLIVKDVPSNVQDIVTLIKTLDKQTPQVMIEARIVEASTDFSRELGIQWGYNYYDRTGKTRMQVGIAGTKADTEADTNVDVMTKGIGPSNTAFAVNLPAAVGLGSGGAFGIGFSKITGGSVISMDLNLSALESAGKGKVISSPKVLALDNKEATIKQGTSIPYESTSASGTTTTWVDAVLELTVTPHITPDNSIIMKIKASKNAPNTTVRSSSGVPSIDKKEANTEILIKDGETVVIGGIYQVEKSDGEDGIPFLSKIPVLGWLFKKESIVDSKRELLIFLTPKIAAVAQ